MDGFTGFKSAAAEELPGARAVMDRFHVVYLAGDALGECRRRIGPELHHEIITLGRTLKRRAGDIGLLRPPPHQQWPYRSDQRPPRTPTRICPRVCETSPTTSPEHSSKQEDSDPNYTPNYEEPVIPTSTFYVFQYPPLK